MKIKNIDVKIRCIQKTIDYNEEKFEVFIVKDSNAKVVGSKIILNDQFFSDYTKDEQIAVLYHEKYHQKPTNVFRLLFNIIRFFSVRKALWQEEFNADEYAKEKVNEKAVLSFLKKSKEFYKSGKVEYNKKTHPPIDDRISRIENSDK